MTIAGAFALTGVLFFCLAVIFGLLQTDRIWGPRGVIAFISLALSVTCCLVAIWIQAGVIG
jgi:hypothetical protein